MLSTSSDGRGTPFWNILMKGPYILMIDFPDLSYTTWSTKKVPGSGGFVYSVGDYCEGVPFSGSGEWFRPEPAILTCDYIHGESTSYRMITWLSSRKRMALVRSQLPKNTVIF